MWRHKIFGSANALTCSTVKNCHTMPLIKSLNIIIIIASNRAMGCSAQEPNHNNHPFAWKIMLTYLVVFYLETCQTLLCSSKKRYFLGFIKCVCFVHFITFVGAFFSFLSPSAYVALLIRHHDSHGILRICIYNNRFYVLFQFTYFNFIRFCTEDLR